MAKQINIFANLIDKQLKKQLQALQNGKYNINVNVNNANVGQTSNQVHQLSRSANSANSAFGKLGSTISETFSTSRMTMTAFLAVMNEIRKAGKNAQQTIQDLDKAITDLSIASNMSREDTAKLVKNYNDYAKELKSTTTDVTSAADDYLRAGKSMNEAQELIKDSIMLSKLGQIDSAAATEDLLATMNGFNMSVEETGKALDAMVAVDMKAATSAGDIATALKYCASSADVAGVSFNKLVGMISATQDKTQQSAETIGTFTNTILSRYRDVKIGKYLSEDGDDISDYESVLKSIGISLRNNQGEFRDFEMILGEMAEKWDYLSSTEQNALIKVTSGTRQANRFIALMEGYNKVLELTDVAANSAGIGVEKFNNSFANSLEAQKNTLQASFESMIVNSDMDSVYSGILEATTALVEFIDKTNALKGVFAGLTTSMALKFFVSAKTGAKEAYLSLNQFSNALKIVKQTNISTGDFDRLLLLSKNLSSSQMKLLLSSKNLTLVQKEQILVNSGLSAEESKLKLQTWGMATAQNGLTVATTSLANAFRGLIASMVANPIILLTTVISGAVMAYQSYAQKIEEARQKSVELTNSYKEQQSSLDSQIQKYKELKTTLDNGNISTDEARSIKEQLLEIQKSLIESYGNEASNIDLVNGKYKEQLGLLGELSKQKANEYVAENRDVFADAKKELERIRTFNIGAVASWSSYAPETEDQKRLIEYLKTYSDLLDLTYTGAKNATTVSLSVKADVKNADEVMHQLYQDLDQYGKENNIDLSGLLEGISEQIKKTQTDKLTEYKAIYEEFIKAEIVRNDTLRPLYQESIQAVEDYNNALSSGEGVEEAKANLDSVQQSVQNATGELEGSQDVFNAIYEGINKDAEAAYNLGQAFENKNTQDYADQLRDISDIDLNSDNIKSFADAWSELKASTDDSTKKLADNLTELAESGQLTVEAFTKEDSTGYFENLGISAEKAVKEINDLVSASTQLNALSEQISKMSDMLADKKNGTTASAADLAGFDVEVRGLDSWKEFEAVMGDSTSSIEDCQKAANALATEWVNNSNFLANLTEQNKQYYITQLDNMGIENAEAIVEATLTQKINEEALATEYATIATAYNSSEKGRNNQITTDLINITGGEIQQLLNEGKVSVDTANNLANLVVQKKIASGTTLSTAADIKNLADLAGASTKLGKLLNQLAAIKQGFTNGMPSEAAAAQAESLQKQIEALVGGGSNTAVVDVPVEIKPTGSSTYKAPSSGSKQKDTKQTIDWIERLLDVLQKKIDQTKAKFDNLFTVKSKKNNLTTQIMLTKNLLTATAKAAERYKKAASNVKLSDSLKKKVREGSYDINEYDSKTSDAITKYKDYYDKYKELKQQADELTTDIRSLRTERYQLYVDDAEAKIAKSQAYAELDAGNYKEQNKHIEYQKKQIKEQYKYQIKIAKLNKDSVEVAKLRAELQNELNDLTKQEFDNIANTYDNKIGLTNNKIQSFQDQISLLEAKGQQIGSALYTKQMSLNNANEKKLVAEREKLIAKLEEIPKNTEKWYDAVDTLFAVDGELTQIQIDNANLQKSINQLKFDRFDDLLDKLNDIVDETDFLIDMLDSENFFDDNGKITDDGITAMGLNAQKYDVYLAEAQRYKEQMAELEKDYQNGIVDPETYEAKMREYQQGQRDMISSANSVKKSLVSLVKEGLDAQNEALEESINKQKELLSQQKESRDFNKKMLDLDKEIARTERQLQVLSGDDSESNRKTIRELKSKLEDLKQDRDNTLYDKSIEQQNAALDKMLKDSEDAAKAYLKDSESVFISALNQVNANTETVSKNIERISKETGVDISDNITNVWKQSGNAVSDFGTTVSSTMPGVLGQISLVTEQMRQLADESEKAAKSLVNATEGKYTDYTTNGADSKVLSDIEWYISKNGATPKKSPSSHSLLNQYIYKKTGKVIAEDKLAGLAKILGVKGVGKDTTADDRSKILKALKDAGFSSGDVINAKDLIRQTGEDGLALVKHEEAVLTKPQWQSVRDLGITLTNMNQQMYKPYIPEFQTRNTQPINNNININTTVEGVATDKIVKDFENVATKSVEKAFSKVNNISYTSKNISRR